MLGGFPAWICTQQPSRDLSKEKPQSLTFVLGATLESYVCSWPRPCLGLKAMGAYWELGPVRALHPGPVPVQKGEGGSSRAHCPASGATWQCLEMFLL